MSIREDVLDMKKEVEELRKDTNIVSASDILKDYKVANKRLFIVCIMLIVFLGIVVLDDIYIRNDIATVTTERNADKASFNDLSKTFHQVYVDKYNDLKDEIDAL